MELNITEQGRLSSMKYLITGLDWLREAGQLLCLLWDVLLERLHRAQRTHLAPLALNALQWASSLLNVENGDQINYEQ